MFKHALTRLVYKPTHSALLHMLSQPVASVCVSREPAEPCEHLGQQPGRTPSKQRNRLSTAAHPAGSLSRSECERAAHTLHTSTSSHQPVHTGKGSQQSGGVRTRAQAERERAQAGSLGASVAQPLINQEAKSVSALAGTHGPSKASSSTNHMHGWRSNVLKAVPTVAVFVASGVRPVWLE